MDISMESAPGDKIRLFRAMFRGREDVHARGLETPPRSWGWLLAVAHDIIIVERTLSIMNKLIFAAICIMRISFNSVFIIC